MLGFLLMSNPDIFVRDNQPECIDVAKRAPERQVSRNIN